METTVTAGSSGDSDANSTGAGTGSEDGATTADTRFVLRRVAFLRAGRVGDSVTSLAFGTLRDRRRLVDFDIAREADEVFPDRRDDFRGSPVESLSSLQSGFTAADDPRADAFGEEPNDVDSAVEQCGCVGDDDRDREFERALECPVSLMARRAGVSWLNAPVGASDAGTTLSQWPLSRSTFSRPTDARSPVFRSTVFSNSVSYVPDSPTSAGTAWGISGSRTLSSESVSAVRTSSIRNRSPTRLRAKGSASRAENAAGSRGDRSTGGLVGV
ncbi:MAG: hypothetical protein MK538_17950, partial [Planctomycetes bacterium]|nr:hypothetical protein [Planctomycetota bacterium]